MFKTLFASVSLLALAMPAYAQPYQATARTETPGSSPETGIGPSERASEEIWIPMYSSYVIRHLLSIRHHVK